MFNLLNIVSSVFNFLEEFVDMLAVLSILLGISIIKSKNPILSVLFLIGLFLSISLSLILLGYHFIGLSYLLVYLGAVYILFLFILMLINIRISELLSETSNSIPLAVFTGFSFYIALSLRKLCYSLNINPNIVVVDKTKNIFTDDLVHENEEDMTGTIVNNNDFDDIYYAVSNSWDNYLIDFTDIASVGNILYSTYGIWLIICSIILLLAMIGAITITKKEKY